jgi:hypothetical protein
MIHITIIAPAAEAEEALGLIRSSLMVMSYQRPDHDDTTVTITVQAVPRTAVSSTGKDDK